MRRKNAEQKRLGGTYRSDRASNGGLKIETGIPVCPVKLSEEAQIKWSDLCQKLMGLRVLTTLDVYVISMFCETYVRWDKLMQFLQANGDSYLSETGLFKLRPEVQSLKESLASLAVLTLKLCLSPEDRQILTIELPAEADPLSEFLRRGAKEMVRDVKPQTGRLRILLKKFHGLQKIRVMLIREMKKHVRKYYYRKKNFKF